AELKAGRLGLRETAALFRDLDGDRPVYIDVLRWHNPGSTDEECYCRTVIRYVEPGATRDDRARETARRLEAELACLLATGGVTRVHVHEAVIAVERRSGCVVAHGRSPPAVGRPR